MKLRKSSGLVMDLRMKEGDGTTAYDSSRYRNDSALTGCKWVENGLEFNGSSDFVNCGNDASLDVSESFTIGAYVKTSVDGTILQKRTTLYEEGYFFYISSGRLRILIEQPDNTNISLIGNTSMLSGDWYHVVAVRDYGNEIGIYVNGNSDQTPVADTLTQSISNNEPLYIGKQNDNTLSFNGSISDVRIYNRALNASEIKQYYDATKYKYL